MFGYSYETTALEQMGGYFFILSINPMEYKSISAKMKYISMLSPSISQIPI